MTQGWTSKGKYQLNEKVAIFRIETVDYGAYLFIFSDDFKTLERDELHNSVEDAKQSAFEWGARHDWLEEVWKISFANPEKGFNVSSFYDSHGISLFDFLKGDSKYLS